MTDWDAYRQDLGEEALKAEPVQWLRVQQILNRCVGSVLDVGGGDGVIARLLMERGHEVLVVEASRNRVQNCVANNVPAIHVSEFTEPHRRDGWDTVLFGEVLEHDVTPFSLLQTYAPLARERVVISVPLDGWPDPTHQWRISLDVLEAPSPHTDFLRPDPQRQIVMTWQRGLAWPADYWNQDPKWHAQFVEGR